MSFVLIPNQGTAPVSIRPGVSIPAPTPPLAPNPQNPIDPQPANSSLAPLPNTPQQTVDFQAMAAGGDIANYHVLVEMGIIPAVLDPDGIAAANLIQPVVSPDFNVSLLVQMEDGSNVVVTKNPSGYENLYRVFGVAEFEAKNKVILDAKLSKLTNDRWGLSFFKSDIHALPPSTWPLGDVAAKKFFDEG